MLAFYGGEGRVEIRNWRRQEKASQVASGERGGREKERKGEILGLRGREVAGSRGARRQRKHVAVAGENEKK